MTILYLDMVGGAAGDMLLAALIDAGASLEVVQEAVEKLNLVDVQVILKDARSGGLRARQIDVMVRGELADQDVTEGASFSEGPAGANHHHHHRSYADVLQVIRQAALSAPVQARAERVFARLAAAEAKAHGVAVENVEFHEVGADDALVDIVGCAAALTDLDPAQVVASPFPLGHGLTRGAHGPIPLPGPAVLEILRGFPTQVTDLAGETVTPTGAALVTEFSTDFGPFPAMRVSGIGVGAGHKQWPDRPNILRAVLGVAVNFAANTASELVVEANIDDMNPEHHEALETALFAAGAIDVWRTPVTMKKGRPAVIVSALATGASRLAVEQALFTHSTTIGLRTYQVERSRLERFSEAVSTPYGEVSVKVVRAPDGLRFTPEHEDCARAARMHDVSVQRVHDAALAAALALGLAEDPPG